MPKNIVLFSDGTGNSAASLFKTNVRRLYEALDLTDPLNPTIPRQFASYDDGVGTSSFRPLKIAGGAFGLGLAQNVRDLYEFLCRMHCPGDRIYGFGFSRGAFTIRVLIGLVLDQGLVPYDGNEAALKRNALAAYRAYRRKYQTTFNVGWPFREARDRLVDARDHLLHGETYAQMRARGAGTAPDDLTIQFLGLWDTVDAYGLPVDELTRAVDRFIWRMTMRDLVLNKRVLRARHALSLDDERNTFHPRLWNEETFTDSKGIVRPGEKDANLKSTTIDDERIAQVWFAGVHADVGGGYADDSLAHVSLKWMIDEAQKYGLRFQKPVVDKLMALEDESGPIHDSRRGLAGYYRYNPRRVEALCHSDDVRIPRPKIHQSVFRRIKVGQDGYAPLAVPPGFAIVMLDGRILDGPPALGMTPADTERFARAREHAWNWVWWRRVVYFATLGLTFAALLLPLLSGAEGQGACVSRACSVSWVIAAASRLLPWPLDGVLGYYAVHPGLLLVFAALIGGGIWGGRVLERRVGDQMRANWYGVPALRTARVKLGGPPPRPSAVNRAVEWLRTRPAYRTTFRFLTHGLLPGLFLAAIACGAAWLLVRVPFGVAESAGLVCRGSGQPRPVDGVAAEAGPFGTADLCAATGIALAEGRPYRILVTIPADGPWTDRDIPAGPQGVREEDVTAFMTLAGPLRRHADQPYFLPFARIGDTGTDRYLLAFTGPAAVDGGSRWEARLVPRRSGELFLYVNDTPLTYWNNHGAFRVRVEPDGGS